MLKEIFSGISPLAGFCPFSAVSGKLIDCRALSRLPQNPETVIVFCFPYLLESEKYSGLNVSRYAAVPDYHLILKKRLDEAAKRLKEAFPANEFSVFADNSPIPEVFAACAAGLGVKGENSLLITEEFGSYVFIGEIVTDLAVPCEAAEQKSCLRCGKCISACPGKAIEGGRINRALCLSDITQKKSELTESEKAMIAESGCAWGCDICQTVCPMNKNALVTDITEFSGGAMPVIDRNTDISGRAFEWRGKKVIERNIDILAKGEQK